MAWQPVRAPAPRRGVAPLRRAGAAAVVLGHHIYLMGGRHKCDGCRMETFFDDVSRYDTATGTWTAAYAPLPAPRAHHVAWATPSGRLRVACGSDAATVRGEVWSYDPEADEWEDETGLLTGEPELLARTASAVAPAPAWLGATCPDAVMLFGGYGVGGVGPPRWLADTVLLDGWHVSRVALSADPEPRGYHALVSLGGRFFALGGRAALPGAPRKARLVRAAVFALELDPRAQAAVGFGDRILVHGGTSANKVPRGDVVSLVLRPGGDLQWSAIDAPTAGPRPAPRAAHALAVVADCLYAVGGYGDSDYPGDAWRLALAQTTAVARASALTPPRADARAGRRLELEWRTAKRHRLPESVIENTGGTQETEGSHSVPPPPRPTGLAAGPAACLLACADDVPAAAPTPGPAAAPAPAPAPPDPTATLLARVSMAEQRAAAAEEKAAEEAARAKHAEREAAAAAAEAKAEAAARKEAENGAEERRKSAEAVRELNLLLQDARGDVRREREGAKEARELAGKAKAEAGELRAALAALEDSLEEAQKREEDLRLELNAAVAKCVAAERCAAQAKERASSLAVDLASTRARAEADLTEASTALADARAATEDACERARSADTAAAQARAEAAGVRATLRDRDLALATVRRDLTAARDRETDVEAARSRSGLAVRRAQADNVKATRALADALLELEGLRRALQHTQDGGGGAAV